MTSPDLRLWQAGWGRARSFPPAVEEHGALRVDVGLPGRAVEYVVLDADEHPRRVERVAAGALRSRDPWVTVPTRDAGRTADRLTENGLRTPPLPEWVMSIALADQRRVATSEDLSWAVEQGDGVVRVTVHAFDGAVAATGQLGVVGDCAVPDKIETRSAYRRRGLGSTMMTVLADTARDLGATRGLLMASTQGRALYTSLGWHTLCPVVIGRLWE